MRMSSDGQIESIPNQRLALSTYARHHKMQIVREYVDPGRSGVAIRQRSGMLRLIHDVTAGTGVDFDAVLVYDVARWGRFQDPDESAHYEFICKNAGIKVIYVAELFANDDSLAALLLKTLSRARAAEDSRVLSVKVFAAQSRLARKGFKQGGPAGYGLRRASIEPSGNVRRELEAGERKGALTDHVVFVPGPVSEVAWVRRIFDWYVYGDMGDTEIARALNAAAVPSESGRLWTPPIIANMLTNEKYIGTLVYNRTTQKLQTTPTKNPNREWIRKRDAFPALVDREVFCRAQELRSQRAQRFSREELLGMLRMVYREHGKVSTKLISEDARLPSINVFMNRFETLTKALEFADIPPTPRATKLLQNFRKTEAMRREKFLEICECVICAGASISSGHHKNTFMINDEVLVRMHVSRARRLHESKPFRWYFPLRWPEETQFVIAVQLEPNYAEIRALYLVPSADFSYPMLIMREEWPDEYRRYRYSSLEEMFGL
ncbi:recombinase family protein [Duganella sp. FT135W]|uniref:Recombinase family protein n=1 Tax=Duganella flavida TaxID=2692175 RepID=A0A6L8KI46_9BURK|nr:recombinase family protein [Duganella flavida]MYM25484.1 recombinase family protein [Duganella flavida]